MRATAAAAAAAAVASVSPRALRLTPPLLSLRRRAAGQLRRDGRSVSHEIFHRRSTPRRQDGCRTEGCAWAGRPRGAADCGILDQDLHGRPAGLGDGRECERGPPRPARRLRANRPHLPPRRLPAGERGHVRRRLRGRGRCAHGPHRRARQRRAGAGVAARARGGDPRSHGDGDGVHLRGVARRRRRRALSRGFPSLSHTHNLVSFSIAELPAAELLCSLLQVRA